jgi:hypothetical protein
MLKPVLGQTSPVGPCATFSSEPATQNLLVIFLPVIFDGIKLLLSVVPLGISLVALSIKSLRWLSIFRISEVSAPTILRRLYRIGKGYLVVARVAVQDRPASCTIKNGCPPLIGSLD